jgi:ubiquitin-protein ligase
LFSVYPDGKVCISILVRHPCRLTLRQLRSMSSVDLTHMPCLSHLQHAPGEDQYGHEDAGERWMPVHGVESIVSLLRLHVCTCSPANFSLGRTCNDPQLISVISLLSQDIPNLDGPANVDAAVSYDLFARLSTRPSCSHALVLILASRTAEGGQGGHRRSV